jgi:hypothetical protein
MTMAVAILHRRQSGGHMNSEYRQEMVLSMRSTCVVTSISATFQNGTKQAQIRMHPISPSRVAGGHIKNVFYPDVWFILLLVKLCGNA